MGIETRCSPVRRTFYPTGVSEANPCILSECFLVKFHSLKSNSQMCLAGVLCGECFIIDEQFKTVNGLDGDGDSNHQWCCVWSVVLATLCMDVYMSMMV